MTQLLNTAPDIIAWLDFQGVKNYTLLKHKQYGFVVDVNGDVNLANSTLTAIAVKFNHVNGFFYCEHNQLISLEGCPESVSRNFSCHHNHLTTLEYCPKRIYGYFAGNNNQLRSLEGCPQTVRGYFDCSSNQLKNLHFAPHSVGWNFSCSHNQLTSLEGCPQTVSGHFNCRNNQITSLEYCPQSVSRLFLCSHNPLLGPTQDITNFHDIYLIHQKIAQIKQEKNDLSQILDSDFSLQKSKLHKI